MGFGDINQHSMGPYNGQDSNLIKLWEASWLEKLPESCEREYIEQKHKDRASK